MKPAPFGYAAAGSGRAAAALLAGGERMKLMAGAQSLGPMLNLRLARPGTVVDVSRAPDMRGFRDEGDAIVYGGAVTHAEIEDGVVPDATPGWLSAVARRIAYRAVRNRGTIGGSLAHADPAADWVNVMTALGGAALLAGPQADRSVPLAAFFTGPFATVLAPDEVITGIRLLKRGPAARWAYWKFCRKVGEFAKASAAVLIDKERGETRILLGAIERPPVFLPDPEALLSGHAQLEPAVAAAAPALRGGALALHVAAVRRAIALATCDARA
ncbi:MAG: FAD binding domain-containing protein [Hyphomicrobiales bacterium]